MKRVLVGSVFTALMLAVMTSANAVITPVVDYTFDDASSLAPFTLTGTPTVSGGQLQLDGSSYLEILDPLAGAVDLYVMEAIVTATAFDTFDFAAARNDPAGAFSGNNGQGLLFQDFGGGPGQIHALNSNAGFATSTLQLPVGVPTAVALVQEAGTTTLYVDGDPTPAATTTAAIVGSPTNLGIGTHPFDGVNGAFNGSIDRVRISTFTAGQFDPNTDLLVSCNPGDVDNDGDIDTADLTTAIQNFTGAGGTGKDCSTGDTDDDGDVDTVDLTFSISNFTGALAGDPNVPDLIYNPADGNVTIDTEGQDVISFSLQGGPFNTGNTDFSGLPAGLNDNIAAQIGWTSFNIGAGLVGVADLGNILPAGLSEAGLQAALAGGANYGLSVVTGGGGAFDVVFVPEPASIMLMGIGALAIVRRRRAG